MAKFPLEIRVHVARNTWLKMFGISILEVIQREIEAREIGKNVKVMTLSNKFAAGTTSKIRKFDFGNLPHQNVSTAPESISLLLAKSQQTLTLVSLFYVATDNVLRV